MRLSLASLSFVVACAASGDVVEDEGWGPDGKSDEASNPLRFASYDVLFTNPLCRAYTYEQPVSTADGSGVLTGKPKNVWCSREDMAASAARPSSPQHKLMSWLDELGPDDEVFLAYLSFSNAAVGDKLCALAQSGTKVTFVLDATSPQSEKVKACGGEILLRGHVGSLGFAHNKLIIINPRADTEHMRLVFSSGNMSSGVVTHHENWHFLEVARDSFFAQNHLCMMGAQIDPVSANGKLNYRDAINACRKTIAAKEESDIKSFFIPNRDDAKRAEAFLLGAIDDAALIDLGAHRFGHSDLIGKLEAKLAAGDLILRMVADDDLYWVDPEVGEPSMPGANDELEGRNVARLEAAGADNFEIRYFETNHQEHLLHHNKYLIYRTGDGAPFGLLAGAANLTRAGFNDNFENIYYIKIPHVLAAFDTQFARVWDGKKASPDEQDPPIATPRHLMPATNAVPR